MYKIVNRHFGSYPIWLPKKEAQEFLEYLVSIDWENRKQYYIRKL